MNVTAIIAEYNPFHKGHEYQLTHAKEATGADYVLVLMSGDFTQRGEPAIIDKYARARMAVENGADLVLELPLCYATGSAEYFARGAVSLLNQLGVVTHLAFGSECGEIDLLKKAADLLEPPTGEFTETISSYMKTGMTFPQARVNAICDLYPEHKDITNILSSPNNILGIEYLKALRQFNSSIVPFTTLRKGSGYHVKELTPVYASALSIREAFHSGITPETLTSQLPDSCCAILAEEMDKSCPIILNDFSDMLLYKLMTERNHGFDTYFDVTADLSDRIDKRLEEYQNPRDFIELLKTKEMTYTRISRALLHILLNIKEAELASYKADNRYTYYGRVLAAKKESLPLISTIATNSCISLITKASDIKKISDETALKQLRSDMDGDALYQAVVANKFHVEYRNENKRRIQII